MSKSANRRSRSSDARVLLWLYTSKPEEAVMVKSAATATNRIVRATSPRNLDVDIARPVIKTELRREGEGRASRRMKSFEKRGAACRVSTSARSR
jgi:hypothetical protein